jgi:uncharacterized YigZ family protein
MYIINPANIYIYEYVINKSKFISYLCSYDSFENTLKKAKKSHPKASHYVWAYRFIDKNSGVLKQKSFDDGEPKKCGGSPILNILQKQNIINTANIIVRYFGGVKLGASGLIRAYSTSTKEVLQNNKNALIPYKIYNQIKIYCLMSELEYIKHCLKLYNLEIIKIKYIQNKASLYINGTKENLDIFIKKANNRIIK